MKQAKKVINLAKYNTEKYKQLVAIQLNKAITGKYYLPTLRKGSDRGFVELAAIKAMAIGITALVIAFAATGCASTSHMGQYAQISGTPEGLRALGDTLIGMQKTAKESQDASNEYMALRVHQEQETTKRATAPGFFTGLFQGNGGAK